ncbi:DUF309 domain-containing protein [Fictibacillus enclensis]|uniref:DUF309 domain-containing protein n=1 Tax=Fictibacillus enclensis TaxID=1017270 RepID=UPI0025A0B7FB|nr:DUF309 domain-containing protein [Fictibacillus enclensis]MDM5339664.1 DUF309 domain-containing protein [Fictibacillus enclensis]
MQKQFGMIGMKAGGGMNYPMEYYQFFISFNEGDYYTCHDLLEEMWMTDKSNYFLKGLLQMSVAVYHYEYGNVKGARVMMEAARHYLTDYRPFHWGMDLEHVYNFIVECLRRMPKQINMVSFEEVDSLPVLPELILLLKENEEE